MRGAGETAVAVATVAPPHARSAARGTKVSALLVAPAAPARLQLAEMPRATRDARAPRSGPPRTGASTAMPAPSMVDEARPDRQLLARAKRSPQHIHHRPRHAPTNNGADDAHVGSAICAPLGAAALPMPRERKPCTSASGLSLMSSIKTQEIQRCKCARVDASQHRYRAGRSWQDRGLPKFSARCLRQAGGRSSRWSPDASPHAAHPKTCAPSARCQLVYTAHPMGGSYALPVRLPGCVTIIRTQARGARGDSDAMPRSAPSSPRVVGASAATADTIRPADWFLFS